MEKAKPLIESGEGYRYNIMFYLFTRFIFYKNLILILSVSFISCNIQDNFKTNFPNNDFDKKSSWYSSNILKKYWAEHSEKALFALLPKTI